MCGIRTDFLPMNENISVFVNLKDTAILNRQFDVNINSRYFQKMQGIISGGDINATVTCINAKAGQFVFHVHSEGCVFTPCDRCLDDVELRINNDNDINVCFGDEDDDDGDVVFVNERNPELDLSFIVYQFVLLSLPIRRVHQPGMCNEAMMKSMRLHQVARSDDEQYDEDSDYKPDEDNKNTVIDQRWEKLKQLLNK